MARPRKFKTPKELEEAWKEYCNYCINHKGKETAFSSKLGKFITAEVPKPISPSIKGFCQHIGLVRQALYKTYENKKGFCDTFTRMREEEEVLTLMLYETGQLPPQLAPLRLSQYGYSTKIKNDVKVAVPVVISGDSEVKD